MPARTHASQGEQRTLALALRLGAHRLVAERTGTTPVLVLDDPLSALDVHTEARVEQALRPILADCTALIVVHRPSTISLADRAAFVGRFPDVAAALLTYAQRNQVDHIVIGARGASTLRRYLGSVSSAVSAEAECTVTVVRAPHEHRAGVPSGTETT